MTLYVNLAELLGTRIEQGFYRPGDRLPSVRALSVEHGVSLSTVQQAYRVLEDVGLAMPKPKSGYFVPVSRELPELPVVGRPAQRPVDISQWDQVLELIRAVPRKDVVQLGRGMPDITTPTMKPLLRNLARISRRQDMPGLYYDNICGTLELREQIARLMLDSGCQLSANDLVITTGCHEALSTSIRSICEPGDIVAVDSPSFHGAMQTLKGLGMKALEIPTDPLTGISLEALELALEQWPIKAIQLTPNCNNPLGYIMPESRKRALLTLAQRFDVAIIEDDVYGELAYTYPRPPHDQILRRRRPRFCSAVLFFQDFGTRPAHWLGRTGPLSGTGAAHEVHQHRLHRAATADCDCRISQGGAFRTAFAEDAHAIPAQSRRNDRLGDPLFFPPAPGPAVRKAASCCGSNCRRASTP